MTPILSFLVLAIVAQAKLYQIVSMFRHGARYAIDDYYDARQCPYPGELTSVGMHQHQRLGNLLKHDYIDQLGFLSSEYREEEIDVYSTDVNRTLQSVRSQLYGLYGLGKGQKMLDIDKKYSIPPFSSSNDSSEGSFALPQGYQQIPVEINSSVVLTYCKNFEKQLQKNVNLQRTVYQEMNLTYYPFLKKLANVFNISLDNMTFQINSYLYDVLTVDLHLGRKIPSEISQDDYLNMRHLHYWHNFLKISYNISKAINTGKLQKVFRQFDDRIAHPNKTLKWSFLSAHDVDITAMLQDLNISSSQCIEQLYRKGKTTALNCDPNQEYASNIIFELHSNDGKNYDIKIRHDGKYVYLCGKKDLSCPYQDWKKRASKILVDIHQVCDGPE